MTELRWDRPSLGGAATDATANAAGPTSDGLPPLHDPFLAPGAMAAQRAELSRLALTSVIAALFPVGSIAAIVFGSIARRELASNPRRTGARLATVGIVLGSVMTMVYGGLAGLWIWQRHTEPAPIAQAAEAPKPSEPAVDKPDPAVATPPSASADPQPGGSVPKTTKLQKMGGITLVDVGVSVTSLQEELARQRAEATSTGETLLVMTTKDGCKPCQGVESSLKDPLMQTALARVRIVRVDIDVFHDDLDSLRMPNREYPYYFLLSVDLTPKDGISGGEWDDDIAQNIAPVLGAFVRGKYTSRRQVWRPHRGSGVRL